VIEEKKSGKNIFDTLRFWKYDLYSFFQFDHKTEKALRRGEGFHTAFDVERGKRSKSK
jgi:hypothetical protein